MARIISTPSISHRRHYVVLVFGLLILASSIGAGIVWWENQRQYTVTITINGNVQEFSTTVDTVGAALQDANVLIDPADRVEPALESPLADNMTITVTKAQQLVLDYNGEIQRIYTHESNPYRILDEQNISLNPDDQFMVNYRPVDTLNGRENIRHLQVLRAKQFTIIENATIIAQGSSTAATIGALLAEIDIPLYVADLITPSLDQPFEDDLTVEIVRSIPITIEADGKILQTRALGQTVNDAINGAGFPLSGQDYTIPAPDTPLEPSMTIEIVRVLETIEEQRQILPYRTLYYPTPNMANGEQEVIQIGAEGIQVTQVRIRYENGQVVSRTTSLPWVMQPPIYEIIAYGVQ